MDTTTEKHDFFHSFCLNPDVRFESQHINERVLLLLRAHPVTQISWVINAFFLIILVIVLNFVIGIVFTPVQIIFFNIMSAAFIFSYVLYNFLLWYFNVGIITNEQIVDIDFHGVLYKEVTGTKLEKVEEVTSKSLGYFGSLFDYGTVYVETAGADVNIEFERIPHPGRVVGIINDILP